MGWLPEVASCILLVPALLYGQRNLPNLATASRLTEAIVRTDGKIYVLGFPPQPNNPASPFVTEEGSLELYDPATGSKQLASFSFEAFLQNDFLLLDNARLLRCGLTSSLYNPVADSWQTVPLSGAGFPAVRLADGRILRAAGSSFFPGPSYLIDPNSFSGREVARMNTIKAGGLLLLLSDQRVLAVGGSSGLGGGPPALRKEAEVFDPKTLMWNEVAPMHDFGASVGLGLKDGRELVIATLAGRSEIYDPVNDEWRDVPGFRPPAASRLNLLPDGRVLVTGGEDSLGAPLGSVGYFDPDDGGVRSAGNLKNPRKLHGSAVMPDGSVLVLGGLSTGNIPTNTVERVAWEPRITTTLEPGYYVATVHERDALSDGFWGLDIRAAELDGGLNFGGLLADGGKEVGFGGFHVAEAQTLTITVNLQALPGAVGPLEFTLQLLDVNKSPIGEAQRCVGTCSYRQAVQPGFYVVEFRSSERAPATSFQATVQAFQLQGGGSVGSSVMASAGVLGFAGFYVSSRQDVSLELSNEQTYGKPRGAGNVYLTLKDAVGRVLKRVGPGAPPQ